MANIRAIRVRRSRTFSNAYRPAKWSALNSDAATRATLAAIGHRYWQTSFAAVRLEVACGGWVPNTHNNTLRHPAVTHLGRAVWVRWNTRSAAIATASN